MLNGFKRMARLFVLFMKGVVRVDMHHGCACTCSHAAYGASNSAVQGVILSSCETWLKCSLYLISAVVYVNFAAVSHKLALVDVFSF